MTLIVITTATKLIVTPDSRSSVARQNNIVVGRYMYFKDR